MFEISTTLMAQVAEHFALGATNQYNKNFLWTVFKNSKMI